MVRDRASAGWSHSNVTPTTSSPAPMSNMISVVEGRSETMRIPGSYDRAMTDGGTARGADEQLEHAARVRREAQALRHRLEAASGYAQQTAARVTGTRSKLADEHEDVAKLESFSWARIASTLRNSRAGDLERETAERDAARYAVADAEARDAAARRDVAGLTAELEALGDVESAYAAALAAKEEWALAHAPDVPARITALSTRRGVPLAQDAAGREGHAAR